MAEEPELPLWQVWEGSSHAKDSLPASANFRLWPAVAIETAGSRALTADEQPNKKGASGSLQTADKASK